MSEIASVSAIAQNASRQDFKPLLNNPFVQYVISPALVFSVILFITYKVLNLGELKQKFSTSLDDIDDLKKDSKKLLSHVDIIRTHLVDKTGLNSNLFGTGSPLQPTRLGKSWIVDSGLEQILNENKEKWIAEVKKQLGKEPEEYDVQEKARSFLVSLRDESVMRGVKDFAYEKGMDVEVILRIGGLWLRDDVLEKPRRVLSR